VSIHSSSSIGVTNIKNGSITASGNGSAIDVTIVGNVNGFANNGVNVEAAVKVG